MPARQEILGETPRRKQQRYLLPLASSERMQTRRTIQFFLSLSLERAHSMKPELLSFLLEKKTAKREGEAGSRGQPLVRSRIGFRVFSTLFDR